MTADDFFKWLSVSDSESVHLPLPVAIGPHDALAARLILWLVTKMPPDATQGDLEEILDCAKWWSMYWASVHTLVMRQET